MTVNRQKNRQREIARSNVTLWVALASGTSLATACVDTAPIAIYKDAGELTEAGDATLGEFSDPYPACRSCIATPNDPGPGCGNELTRCMASEGCRTIYECAYRAGCVFKHEYSESLACALPCADGISNAFGEPITAAIGLTMCFHSVCTDVCAVEVLTR